MKRSLGAKTIVMPTPAWVIGTYDDAGKPNAMTVAWGGICCSNPPAIAISLRKATYTYGNIIGRKAFTVNVPSSELAAETDFVGMVSGRSEDKFAMAKLTAVKSELVDAPIISEFPLVLECKVIHFFEIGLHTQFIGEIMDVKAEEDILDSKGYPDIEKLKPLIYAIGTNGYHVAGKSVGTAYSLGKKLMKKGK
jgi:flavin reductase (DIM6/NTAB) family NADH-FMN oxidoreductase RutF